MVVKYTTDITLGTLTVEGGLEIDYESTEAYTLTVDFLIINGGRFTVGWQNNPMQGRANIMLTGSISSPVYTELDGYSIGNKAIGESSTHSFLIFCN